MRESTAQTDPIQVDFVAKRGDLERWRAFLKDLDPARHAVRYIGYASRVSHVGELADMWGGPVEFVRPARPERPAELQAELEAAWANNDAARTKAAHARIHDWDRRARMRFLIRVREIACDEAGNVRAARIEYLDRDCRGVAWTPWPVGRRLCAAGLRLELRDTRRAGLHLRIGVAVEDAPRDAAGHRTVEPRFLSVVRLDREGVIAVAPIDPIEPAVRVDALGPDDQRFLALRHALADFYDLDEDRALACLAGEGPSRESLGEFAAAVA